MDANPVKLVEYFATKRQYLIPLFQRPYIWKKENWETLWDDILRYYGDDETIANSCPHFMGAIVSIPAKTIPVGVDKYLIIDGQQRLTTFSVLLCALRDTAKEQNMSDEIQDYLINKYERGKSDYLKILPTQGDRSTYSKLVDRQINELEKEKCSNSLFLCYNFFKKSILSKNENDQEFDPKRIYDILQKLFQVVMINLTGTDDPYLIFESLNFKGAKLTQADLIRNLILMKFQHSSQEGGEQEKIYRSFWLPLEERLGDQLEEFFFAYLRMKNAVRSILKRIYSDMKTKLNASENIEDLLDDIQKNAKAYFTFLNPDQETNLKVRKELKFLNRTKSQAVYPFLLKLNNFRGDALSEEVYLRCLQILNSFIMRRAICRWQTNVVNSQVINWLTTFPEDVTHLDEWLSDELFARRKQARWPNDTDFRQAIVSQSDAAKPIQVLFLEEIEKFLDGKELVSFQNLTLEHIMPQTLSPEWIMSLGTDYESIHSNYLGNLGNLTLTGYNSEYQNYPFLQKKNMENGYSSSGLKMNLEISQNEKWGKDEIEARAERLADIAIQIWKYPDGIRNQPKLLSLGDTWTYQKIRNLWIDKKIYPVTTWRGAANQILDYIRVEICHNNTETLRKLVKEKELPYVDEAFCLKEVSVSAENVRWGVGKWLQLLNIPDAIFKFEIE